MQKIQQLVPPENIWLKKIEESVKEGVQIQEILETIIEEAGEWVIGKILSANETLFKIEDTIKRINGRIKELPVDYYFILRKKDSNFLEVFKSFDNQIKFLHQTMNLLLKCIYSGELSLYNKNDLQNLYFFQKFSESKQILDQFREKCASEQTEKKFVEELLSELQSVEASLNEITQNVEEIQMWFRDCETIQQRYCVVGKRHSYASQIWKRKRHPNNSKLLAGAPGAPDSSAVSSPEAREPLPPNSGDIEEEGSSSSEDEEDSDSEDEITEASNVSHQRKELKEDDGSSGDDVGEKPDSVPSDSFSSKEFFRKKYRKIKTKNANDEDDASDDDEVCSNLSDDSYSDSTIHFSFDGEKKRLHFSLKGSQNSNNSSEKDSEEENAD